MTTGRINQVAILHNVVVVVALLPPVRHATLLGEKLRSVACSMRYETSVISTLGWVHGFKSAGCIHCHTRKYETRSCVEGAESYMALKGTMPPLWMPSN